MLCCRWRGGEQIDFPPLPSFAVSPLFVFQFKQRRQVRGCVRVGEDSVLGGALKRGLELGGWPESVCVSLNISFRCYIGGR